MLCLSKSSATISLEFSSTYPIQVNTLALYTDDDATETIFGSSEISDVAHCNINLF